jgi:hypothetical protein
MMLGAPRAGERLRERAIERRRVAHQVHGPAQPLGVRLYLVPQRREVAYSAVGEWDAASPTDAC